MRKSIVAALAALTLGSTYAACPAGTAALGTVEGKEACGLQGTYGSSNLLLTSDKIWVLQGGVFIGGDNASQSTITIEPGTKIVGQSGADYLVINRGSQIFAEGTASAPIVMTTAETENRTRGMWGGLIINGNAPINKGCNGSICEVQGEGSTGLYGGNDPEDNSGVLKYVRVEFAGYEITPDNELNGIAFQGVGRGTVVDYIQVHMNADDGVEFFGGTVNVKHVVLTGNKDDSMDWTYGWQGKAQFVIVEQYEDQANNGIEADSSKVAGTDPRSNPELSNLTFIGTMSTAAKGGQGMLLRRGTAAKIYNSIITGFKNGCIDVDGEETFLMLKNDEIVFENMIINCAMSFDMESEDAVAIDAVFNAGFGNMSVDPMLDGYAPMAGSPAMVGSDVTPFDLFFTPVDYIGAVKDMNDTWYAGWTTSARN